MTPKEKAKELIDKYEDVDDCDKHYSDRYSPCSHQARQCAIICVEQIVAELKDVLGVTGSSFVSEEIKHWDETLQHIKNA